MGLPSSAETGIPLLQMRAICKRFGAAQVLSDVDLTLHAGEVLGLVGENGAGKSTIMKILSGAYERSSGDILLDGSAVSITSPVDAQRLGISVIYQELSLFPHLDAVDNVFMHREKTRGPGNPRRLGLVRTLDRPAMRIELLRVLREELDVSIDVDVPVAELPLAEKQLLEIARSLISNARIIVMDEPTEALEDAERQRLFATVRRLRARGTGIIYVSHALDQLLGLCDTVMVLRDGHHVATQPSRDVSVARLIELMVGGSLSEQYPAKRAVRTDVVLDISHLSRPGSFADISLQVHAGEVVGIAGLNGSGKVDLVRAVFGALNRGEGEVTVQGRTITANNPRAAKAAGMAMLPGERKTESIFPHHSIEWNHSLAAMTQPKSARLKINDQARAARAVIDRLRVKAQSPEQGIAALSGGNQQKILFSRWMQTDPSVMLLDEPTRGIDVGAKADVYRLIADATATGTAFLMVSSDGPELVGLCHRVIVLHEGRIAAVLAGDDVTQERIAHFTVQSVQSGGTPRVATQ